MDTTVEEIIKAGKAKIEAFQNSIQTKSEFQKEYFTKLNASVEEMALQLVPEVLRSFTSIENNKLVLQIPGCAVLKRKLTVVSSQSKYDKFMEIWIEEVEKVYFFQKDLWEIHQWTLWHDDDDDEWFVSLTEKDPALASDLEWALARAAEEGNDREALEQQAAEHNKNRVQVINTRAEEEPDLICPLISCISDRESKCIKKRCAWWDSDGIYCTVLNLARV